MSETSFTRSSTGTLGGHAGGPASNLAPRAPWRDWLALALLMFPVLLVAVDNTALTFALPAIARSLDASGVELLWIVDAYPLVLAGLLVAMGSLGDRIGRRRLLFIGSTGFAAVSAATAFAPSAEWLIAGRAGLGFFGAMLMPSTLSLIRNIFPEPNRRRLAVAIWAAGFSGGAALGPIVGGWLVEHFWWGAVLLVAVPIILPLLALGPALIPESRDPNPGRVDMSSIILSLLVMVPVVYGIKVLATHGLAFEPLAAIAFGLLMGYAFIRRQRSLLADGTGNRAAPLLDISLFGNRIFSTAIIANVLALFSFNGFILFLAQHLQLLEGQSPSESGVAMVPALIATVLAGLLVVPLVKKVRPGFVVAFGLLLSAGGYFLVAFGDHGDGPALLLAALLVLCLGVGAAETISNDLILGAAPAEKSGAAAAISETGYEIGSLLGTAILGSILTASYQGNLRLPAGAAEAAPAAASAQAGETLAGAVELAQVLPGPLAESVLAAARIAFDSGVHITATIALVLMAGASVLAAVVLRKVPTAV
ncbi:DHA2 family multidrug resistance protein-like MFS transporter [Arthrobacter ginsengisoli]|uniref:DHA2 family multidrug resistance protein-like MFS transporter n=1 Tax=Arthrobacter ginsengisoli TaxID=1356565 RepID=A0ABU1UHS9_9MICC|nr:MFS transporter [Arthrobacter ginsengisoli]MDR7084751.1 DHA2 family multidrug resistance protein-like MFS transporter [Arthrobacter ginsengisoli]